MEKHYRLLSQMLIAGGLTMAANSAHCEELGYGMSNPPLEATFAIVGEHYSGKVAGGNLLLQSDIPTPAVVRYAKAKSNKSYFLLMIDLDANANGSWPDQVPPGSRAPVRHWLVGNIPGKVLSGLGYKEDDIKSSDGISVVQKYRPPHIPGVSDRYGLFLFEQSGKIDFETLPESVRNFDYSAFIEKYKLGKPIAYNYFVGLFTTESPFSGKLFNGNDVSATWLKDSGKGKLAPQWTPL